MGRCWQMSFTKINTARKFGATQVKVELYRSNAQHGHWSVSEKRRITTKSENLRSFPRLIGASSSGNTLNE